jgi:periplasmic divalent cation tolerance protein
MSALIWCPFPDRAHAEAVAGQLLDEKLVACANLIDSVASLFVWNDERGSATECGALFKTDAAILERTVARLEELHPYDAPAIMGWRVDAPARATADWLRKEAATS